MNAPRRPSTTALRPLAFAAALLCTAWFCGGCGEQTVATGQSATTTPGTTNQGASSPPTTSASTDAGPASANSTHVPKILSIDRWDNAKLAAGGGKLAFPESVGEDPLTGDLYVSNVGPSGEAAAKDGDGYILQLSAAGAVINPHRFPAPGGKLNGPKGIVIRGDRLWVADIDRVYAFDLRGKEGAQLAVLSVPGAEFANDLEMTPDGTLYVSDTQKNFIYMVRDDQVAHGLRKIITRDARGANGLSWNAKTNRLLVAGTDFGNAPLGVSAVDLANVDRGEAVVTDLTGPMGKLDGLAALPSGNFLVSDWMNRCLWWVSADGKTKDKILTGFLGPADFLILKDRKTIIVPDMVRSELDVVHFAAPLE
ncbi:MAG: SMP-30/gluconolactonase/LRE family protein [Planctomycetota bacterium]